MFGRQTRLHEVECLRSSYAKKPGPTSGAFFTHVGAKLWLLDLKQFSLNQPPPVSPGGAPSNFLCSLCSAIKGKISPSTAPNFEAARTWLKTARLNGPIRHGIGLRVAPRSAARASNR